MSGLTPPDGTDSDRPSRSVWRRATDDGERAVSELLGAILLFGLLVAVMVLLQANAVPSQNERIEFDHNQRVQGDVLELSSAAEDVAATGRDRSSVLELAPEYPNRFLLLNPGRAQGRVTTTDADFAIENAVADGETGDYWNGDVRPFDARALEYVPSYNVYRNAPDTVLAHGTVTDRFPDGAVTAIGGSSVVDGRRISLVALDGQRSEARGGALSVELVPLSTETETVTVTDDGSGPLVVRLQTDLDAAEWQEILESELVANGGFVTGVESGPGDTVEIRLQADETYQLRLAKVGVGGGVTDPEPAYLTARGNDDLELEPVEQRELTVQVRDPYNAPEPGVEVTFSETGDGSLDGTTVVTDEDGEATVTYTAGTLDGTVTATIDGGTGGATDPRSVVYDVTVNEGDAGQGSQPGEFNPGGNDALELRDSTLLGCRPPEASTETIRQYDDNVGVPMGQRSSEDDCVVGAQFVSTGQERKVSAIRVAVFDADKSYTVTAGTNTQPRARPLEYSFQGESFRTIGGDRQDVSARGDSQFAVGQERTYEFGFQLDNRRYNLVDGDVFLLRVYFEDGTSSTYLVAPRS